MSHALFFSSSSKSGLAHKIQIFSERCSGSNFMESVLTTNHTGAEITWEYGWKHFFPEKEMKSDPGLNVVVLARSPFRWLRSLHRQPWHVAPRLTGLSFSDFIRQEWECVRNKDSCIKKTDPSWNTEMLFERHPKTGERFRNVLEMRIVKHQEWLKLSHLNPNFISVSYEEIAKSPKHLLQKICQITGEDLPEKLVIPNSYKGSTQHGKQFLHRFTGGVLGNHRNKPRLPITLEDIEFIASSLDADLERTFGYDLEALKKEEVSFWKQEVEKEQNLSRPRKFSNFYRESVH